MIASSGGRDARAQLDTIGRANLFLVPLDEHGEWHRYHHLFGDLLTFEEHLPQARRLRPDGRGRAGAGAVADVI